MNSDIKIVNHIDNNNDSNQYAFYIQFSVTL